MRAIPPVRSPISLTDVVASLRPGRARSEDDPLVPLLEARLRARDAVVTGSGTQALQLALEHAKAVTGRDTVALPAFACYDLVTAAVGAGARILFYDLDPDTLQPDVQRLDQAQAARLAALVMYHPFGIPVDPAPLRALCDRVGALLVEDAAQAHGGSLGGVPLGALGDLSVISFGRGKGWTGGLGGALLLRGAQADPDWFRQRLLPPPVEARVVALAVQWLLGRPALYGLPSLLPWLQLGETLYHAPEPPRPLGRRTQDLIVRHKTTSATEAGSRRENARRLIALLESVTDLHSPATSGEPGYLRLPLRKPGTPTSALLNAAGRRIGLLPSYPLPLNRLPQAQALKVDPQEQPGAEILARELFTAPTHTWVRGRDRQAICRYLRIRSGTT